MNSSIPTTNALADSKVHKHRLKKLRFNLKESLIKYFLAICAILSVVTTISIVAILAKESFSFFSQVSIVEFLTGTRWVPLLEPQSFGVLPLLWGTMIVTIGAAIIALPVGLACAIYLSEFASDRARSIIKPVLELLAGIPTVVYGYFALTFITPLLQKIYPEIEVFNALSGAIVVGIMILPMVTSLSDNALRAVPNNLRECGYALGATPYEVTTGVVVPAGLSGIMASYLLAISRAIGETMAVTLAAGATPNLSLDIFSSIQTMTAYVVQVSLGDTPQGGTAYLTLFAVAALLFVITLVINLISQWILDRYREVYE